MKNEEDQIKEVKRLLSLGHSQYKIEKITGVKRGTISQINLNRQWKHL